MNILDFIYPKYQKKRMNFSYLVLFFFLTSPKPFLSEDEEKDERRQDFDLENTSFKERVQFPKDKAELDSWIIRYGHKTCILKGRGKPPTAMVQPSYEFSKHLEVLRRSKIQKKIIF